MPIASGFEVTLAGVSWTEGNGEEPGALTIQLVVDREVAERVLETAPANAAQLLELLARSAGAGESTEPAGPGTSALAAWVPALMIRP